MIEVRDPTERYGSTLAVDGLTFDIAPGRPLAWALGAPLAVP